MGWVKRSPLPLMQTKMIHNQICLAAEQYIVSYWALGWIEKRGNRRGVVKIRHCYDLYHTQQAFSRQDIMDQFFLR